MRIERLPSTVTHSRTQGPEPAHRGPGSDTGRQPGYRASAARQPRRSPTSGRLPNPGPTRPTCGRGGGVGFGVTTELEALTSGVAGCPARSRWTRPLLRAGRRTSACASAAAEAGGVPPRASEDPGGAFPHAPRCGRGYRIRVKLPRRDPRREAGEPARGGVRGAGPSALRRRAGRRGTPDRSQHRRAGPRPLNRKGRDAGRALSVGSRPLPQQQPARGPRFGDSSPPERPPRRGGPGRVRRSGGRRRRARRDPRAPAAGRGGFYRAPKKIC